MWDERKGIEREKRLDGTVRGGGRPCVRLYSSGIGNPERSTEHEVRLEPLRRRGPRCSDPARNADVKLRSSRSIPRLGCFERSVDSTEEAEMGEMTQS